jgi:predicted CxxxxCH...CXXCH cytochrome family protein
VYCHGSTLTLGTNTKPVWNAPGTAGCGTCHGLPPAAPHPQIDKCEICHADAGPNHTIVDKTKHVNGQIDVNNLVPCQTCHGTAMSAAPPPDTLGNMTSPQVGAHTVHLTGNSVGAPVACTECHVQVTAANPNVPGHYDQPTPAKIIFGALSMTGGLTPTYTGGTCANNYCHGATLPSGTTTSVPWSGGALLCTACHGMPPADAVHGNGAQTKCENCHAPTAGPNQTIATPASHIDGKVDASTSCGGCHGQGTDPTPPKDVNGNLTGPKVGVHQQHKNSTVSSPVACTSCHVSVTTYTSPGHVDHPYPANVIFSGLASAAGAVPSYTESTETCTNTYCHGATLAGGGSMTEVWSDTSGNASKCNGCHGMPPATPAHNGQSATSCNTCHTEVAGPNGTIANSALHVDGLVQVSGGGCTACHGDPPLPGNEAYAGGGGAHMIHANTLGFQCATCHGNNGSGPNHNQGNGTVIRANVNMIFDATVSFTGGTTMNNGGTASYTQSTETCLVGCHNPIVNNPKDAPHLTNAPAWTGANPGCIGCHANVATTAPRNHNVSGMGDTGCLACHSTTGHTSGTPAFNNPNPASGFAYAAGNVSGLCKTCHDAWTGTAFGTTAPDISPYWTTPAAHNAHGYACTQCHAYHGATNTGPLLLDTSNTSCEASGCHANLVANFGQVAGGPQSHHPIEGGSGITLSCESCHNAHISQPNPNAAVNPANRWAIYSIPATAYTSRRSSGDYTAFCLTCHTATNPPGVTGALNIASALSGGTDPSQFKVGSSSEHRSNHSGFNCQNCHVDDHGNAGNTGTNRGQLLPTWIKVNNFPYTGEGSCGTTPTGVTFSCHGG